MAKEEDGTKQSTNVQVIDDSELEEVVRLETPRSGPIAGQERSLEDLGLPKMTGDAGADEVVRLGTPRVGPVPGQERSHEDLALPNMMGDADVDEVPDVIDPESEWLEKEEAKEVQNVPMGWFVLLFLALGGVFVWAMLRSGGGEDGSGAGENGDEFGGGSAERSSSEIFLEDEATQIASAEKHYADLERVLAGFMAAKTVEERLVFVRHPERMKPLMEDYYQRNPFKIYQYETSSEYHVMSLKYHSFIALRALTMNGGSHAILIEDGEDGLLVDWESFVGYQSMSFEELIEKRPVDPVEVRVYGTVDNFYAYEFQEDQGFLCVRLNSRKSDQTIFGYAKKESAVGAELAKYLQAPSGRTKTQPFILKIHFLPDSKAPNSVVIEEVISTLWAYPTNPADE